MKIEYQLLELWQEYEDWVFSVPKENYGDTDIGFIFKHKQDNLYNMKQFIRWLKLKVCEEEMVTLDSMKDCCQNKNCMGKNNFS